MHSERHILAGGQTNVETLLLLEARPAAGESDAEIVDGAWNFAQLNRRYSHYLEVLDRSLAGEFEDLKDPVAAKALRRGPRPAIVEVDEALKEPILWTATGTPIKFGHT